MSRHDMTATGIATGAVDGNDFIKHLNFKFSVKNKARNANKFSELRSFLYSFFYQGFFVEPICTRNSNLNVNRTKCKYDSLIHVNSNSCIEY